MVYILGTLMGYFMGTNYFVEKQTQRYVGAGYGNPIAGQLSKLGALGGWFCVFPAAYFVGSDYGSGLLEGFYFVLAFVGGVMISGSLQIPGLNYIFSALTVFLNIGLVFSVYSLS